jgi:acetyl-CoA C-acetyltransferase
VGSAKTVLRSAYQDRQHVDLIAEAVSQALLGTGLSMREVDFVIDSGSDFLDGRSISNCGFLGVMGAHHKEESRVEEDGLWALTYAATKLLGGTGSVGLVIAYSKSSESDPRNYWSTLAEPFTQRPVGLDHRSAAGLYAQRYLRRHGLCASDLRGVSDYAWERAARRGGTDAAEVDRSATYWDEVVASPLVQRDLARPVDGAVAVVLATEHVARQIDRESVWVTGMGSAIDQHFLAAREPDSLPAAEAAARAAYRMAGVHGPHAFDVVEVSGGSTVGELMVLEALGMAEAGRALALYGARGGGGLNPSGGALPADPVMATGLVRLHEVASELGGRSPSADVGARRGLAHGTGGLGMQNHCVVTLERA